MSNSEPLEALANRVRAAGGLGRSRLIGKLFDFLVKCSATGQAPKETEVAVEVFGKGTGFDVAQDAMVRVYVYKLRRKLEEFYAGLGRADDLQLIVPKGIYRIEVRERDIMAPELPGESPVSTTRSPISVRPRSPDIRGSGRWIVPVLVASVLSNVILAGGLLSHLLHTAPANPVRSSPVWSRMIDSGRPLCVVLGDYYIFAETDKNMEVRRLVREFSINSADDLNQYLKLHPEIGDRYQDMRLNYLPTSIAYALKELVPLTALENSRTRVVMASALTPEMLKSSDIIYIGYLSGLGMLRDLVFSGSRFRVSDTFDELTDRVSRKQYVSQAAMPFPGEQTYHDIGYFATFAGPAGNQLMIVAGMRDVAVRRVAESITHPDTLRELMARSGNQRSFEALYDVFAMNGTDLNGTLLETDPIDTTHIWTDGASAPIAASSHSPAATSPYTP